MSYPTTGRIDAAVIHAGTQLYCDGPLSAASVDSTPVGQTTPAAGKFTTLSATGINSTPVGASTPSTGAFTTLSSTGILSGPVSAAVTASTTQTLAGSTKLTGQINVLAVVANTSDAVALPAMSPGAACLIINNGTHAAAVWPAATIAIDGGTTGVAVTLTNSKSAWFYQIGPTVVISAQMGVASA